ncbi:MAG: CHASE4 domain-containing protein [Chloroflexia bacterium]
MSIGLILAVLLVLLYLATSVILMSSFAHLEEQLIRQDVNRALRVLETEVLDLNRLLRDWAAWDETYAFIETGHPSYIAQNLDDAVFANLRLNLMVFVRYPAQILYSKGFDPQSNRPADVPQSLYAYITPESALLNLPNPQSSVAGILPLPEGPLLVAAQPVLTSRYQGPVHGALIFGRFLSAAELARLSQLIRLNIDLHPYDDPSLPSDFQKIRSSLTQDKAVIVQTPGANSVAGYALLNDLLGRPALIMRIVTSRDVYYAGQAAQNYIFLSLLAIGLIFGEATLILMDRLVISRLSNLSTSVSRVRASGDLTERMLESGKDEITHLAHEINQMLAALQQSQEELQKAQQELEQRVAQRTAELTARADELALLNEIGISLTSQLDFSTIVREALSRIHRLFEASEVALLQVDAWSGELRFVQTLSEAGFDEHPVRAQSGEGFAGWVLEHRQPVLAANASEDPRFSPAVDQRTPLPPRGLMAVPLCTPDQMIGVLEVARHQGDAFTDRHLHTLQGLASMMTIALVNARLYNEVKALLQEREQAQAQLIHAEKMSALGRLMVSISHEINNPLQAIQFSLSLVEEDVARRPRSATTVEYIRRIHTEVERISEIVRRMRDFYRPAREGRQSTDVHAVLDAVLDLCGKQFEHNHIEVERVYAPDLGPIQSNPDHLKQVFLNLVLNAIDAMPNGGKLTVSTSAEDADHPRLRIVHVAFRDTGIGMSPEVQAHLFEPFFTTKEGGSGLGLSISYGIVQSLGGQIQVTSAEGQGSTFTVVLPSA